MILHFEDCAAHLDTRAAERRSKELDGRPGKRIDAGRYLSHRHLAVQRAAALAERHRRNGTVFPQDNPSSTVFELLAAIEP